MGDDVRATFVFASQPDIVRAAQKDEYYLQVHACALQEPKQSRMSGHA